MAATFLHRSPHTLQAAHLSSRLVPAFLISSRSRYRSRGGKAASLWAPFCELTSLGTSLLMSGARISAATSQSAWPGGRLLVFARTFPKLNLESSLLSRAARVTSRLL